MARAFDRFRPTRRFDIDVSENEGKPLRYTYGQSGVGMGETGGFGADDTPDPLGLAIGRRWREQDRAENLAATAAFNAGAGINPNFGRPSAEAWGPFFQALAERDVDRLVGGSAPGSNQMVGLSVQPRYGTSGEMFTNPRTGRSTPNLDYKSTLFAPGQRSAVNDADFEEEQRYGQSLRGLRRATGRR